MTPVWHSFAQLPRRLDGEPHVVDAWLAHLDPPPIPLDELEAQLDRAERERSAGIHRPAARRTFVASRGLLRVLAARYLDVAPGAVRFASEPQGKPTLEGRRARDLQFNVSHSGDVFLAAFAWGARVGADVERVRPVPHLEQVIGRTCSPAEVRYLASRDAGSRAEQLLRHWTAKEAFLKATGLGLSRVLRDVELVPGGGLPCTGIRAGFDAEACARWRIAELPDVAGAVGAVCHEREALSVRWLRWASPGAAR